MNDTVPLIKVEKRSAEGRQTGILNTAEKIEIRGGRKKGREECVEREKIDR